MAENKYIDLERQFRILDKNSKVTDTSQQSISYSFNHAMKNPTTWKDLLEERRCVVLAEAGSGKTLEFKNQAESLKQAGETAFFIRIEYLQDNCFIFEVGDESEFNHWLNNTSSENAYFFLDSVDEARLKDSSAFSKALHHFSNEIKPAIHRCHIFVSSRPCGWRYKKDEQIINKFLPYQEEKKDVLKTYVLEPLNKHMVESFCEKFSVEYSKTFIEDSKTFIDEINQLNLISIASRPFDLINLLTLWNDKNKLGTRSEVIEYNIRHRLDDGYDDEGVRKKTNLDRMLYAKRLAASVILTKKSQITLLRADSTILSAKLLMPNLNLDQHQEILSCAIFDDVLYNTVRFRHREIREYLAALWFKDRLEVNRRDIKNQLFKIITSNQEKVIPPVYSSFLPWLAILDTEICEKLIQYRPELFLENGDGARLFLDSKKSIIYNIVERIKNNTDLYNIVNYVPATQLITADLNEFIAQLIQSNLSLSETPSFHEGRVLYFLVQLAGKTHTLTSCIEPLSKIVSDPKYNDDLKEECLRSLFQIGNTEQKIAAWDRLNTYANYPRFDYTPNPVEFKLGYRHRNIKKWSSLNKSLKFSLRFLPVFLLFILDELKCNLSRVCALFLETSRLISINKLEDESNRLKVDVDPLPLYIETLFKELIDSYDAEELYEFFKGLNHLLIEDNDTSKKLKLSSSHIWLIPVALYIIKKWLIERNDYVLKQEAVDILLAVNSDRQNNEWGQFERRKGKQQTLLSRILQNHDLHLQLLRSLISRLTDGSDLSKPYSEVLRNIQRYDIHLFLKGYDCAVDQNNSDSDCHHLWNIVTNDTEDILVRKFYFVTCFRIYKACENSNNIKTQMEELIASDSRFNEFQQYFNPPSQSQIPIENEESRKWSQYRIEKQKLEKSYIEDMKRHIQANPNLVSDVQPRGFTREQVFLIESLMNVSGLDCSDWESLVDIVGKQGANVYKAFLKSFWRQNSNLPTRLTQESRLIPNEAIAGLSGLSLEFKENPKCAAQFSKEEIELAIHYASWSLNDYPKWLEILHDAHKDLFQELIYQRIESELDSDMDSNSGLSLTIYKISVYAPWIHSALAEKLSHLFIEKYEQFGKSYLPYFIYVISQGLSNQAKEKSLPDLEVIINKKIELISDEDKPIWYALLFEINPNSLDSFKTWLEQQSDESAKTYLIEFLKFLMQGRGYEFFDQFTPNKSATLLGEFYLLICHYFPVRDDPERKNSVIYASDDRDFVQEIRYKIFELLYKDNTSENFYVLKKIYDQETLESQRLLINFKAHEIALALSDSKFSIKDVLSLENKNIFQPTHIKDLYETVVSVLKDIKEHIEKGDCSPYKTWQRVTDEVEMRNLLAEQFMFRLEKFSIAQENELANKQRLDLKINHQDVSGKLPIELKMLQKCSGNEFSERLENQLIGDYLRPSTDTHGIFLIVNTLKGCGKKNQENWEIDGESIPLNRLESKLQDKANSLIREKFKDIEAVKVIVIDTLIREHKSKH
ncbi:NACHT domain-containing protein [Acinetobacter pollinis]|uniref:ATP-binding protein n=1 Tax=Acinetobacter pollinis TaxID=2605270 RepID=A0ABU6DV10_9GAMM|nr:hypothetical protein [Acinetobacter pollinis]MEB5477565.1 hypothetical protein [Acinetobacter pollinis]